MLLSLEAWGEVGLGLEWQLKRWGMRKAGRGIETASQKHEGGGAELRSQSESSRVDPEGGGFGPEWPLKLGI